MDVTSIIIVIIFCVRVHQVCDYKYHNAPLRFLPGRNMAAHCSPRVFLFTFRLLSVLKETNEDRAVARSYSYIV